LPQIFSRIAALLFGRLLTQTGNEYPEVKGIHLKSHLVFRLLQVVKGDSYRRSSDPIRVVRSD
jgi:hypothetical protein